MNFKKNEYPIFEELFGSHVQMNDRFETVHIWSPELADTNRGRWIPKLITKIRYDTEKDKKWNN